MNMGRAKPRRKRGDNYFQKPKYYLPENISLKIALLSIIAQYNYVYYEELFPQFRLFAPHPYAYQMMTSYIRNLVGDIKKLDRGKVMITENGLRKLLHIDKKYGLPKVLKEPIKERLRGLEEELERRNTPAGRSI